MLSARKALVVLIGAIAVALIWIRVSHPSPKTASIVEPPNHREDVSKPMGSGTTTEDAAKVKASARPQFNGYLTIGRERWFALEIPASDGSSGHQSWVRTGEKIASFEIVEFDVKREILKVKDANGIESELGLAMSKVADSDEQLRRAFRELIDTSTRSIRDIPNERSTGSRF
jgi:hypothetical protein